jgi:proteic killer suppression protein
MNITFRDRKLKKAANDLRKLIREYGKKRGEKIKLRLDQLRDADNLEETRYLPGNYHELVGNRKGQWACSLDGNYRLIFTPHEEPIPEDEDGRYIWLEIHGVEIIQIIDYH